MAGTVEHNAKKDRRAPEQVMRLQRLGSLHQSRLSFMRILTRRMQRDQWQFSRPVFAIDEHGVGHAVYTAHAPGHSYSLVAFAHDLPADQRSDRVIAEAWDATFALFDGIAQEADIERLSRNVPLQEAGRISERELSLSRANRSVRLWQHAQEALASGRQPDSAMVTEVGYLMRTTAVYGSGKFGAADRESLLERTEFAEPFQVEMLSVYLTRWFVRDLLQHMADSLGGEDSATLDPVIARSMGIGNSTGLGMAPFILNHPVLLNNWILAREEALARVRSQPRATRAQQKLFTELLSRAILSVQQWRSQHPVQLEKLSSLKRDLALLQERLAHTDLSADYPWDRLYREGENTLGVEAQEYLVSLLLEPHAELVDALAACMSSTSGTLSCIDGAMSVAALSALLERDFGWALEIDWQAREHCARLWYVSAEKLEPRLGERFAESLDDYEQPLAPARDAVALYRLLRTLPPAMAIADVLSSHPQLRLSVLRAQSVEHAPYAEIRDNTIAAELLPIDMLRCKLSFFGAIHFDPRSDRWVRISLFANAPYPEELIAGDADFWPYPPLGAQA